MLPLTSTQIDTFQEWPQLLDPYLSDTVEKLTSAFLRYCVNDRDVYCQDILSLSDHLDPLPRAVCRILNTLCKVRGYKIIVRLLNNEPKYIEPILMCFQTWNTHIGTRRSTSWEERYIMLLWLSHLMLAPFKLATISGLSMKHSHIPSVFDELKLPEVAKTLLDIASQHLYAPGKERESASRLVVRLSLREDMQKLNLSNVVVEWCLAELRSAEKEKLNDQYRFVGLLTLVYGLMNSSTSSEVSTCLKDVFEACQDISTGTDSASVAGRRTAPSRKLVVKIIRATMVHALALAEMGDEFMTNHVEGMLEAGVQILLELLADTDTPVRQAASKALANIILKLDGELAAEIIEAILASLNENILLEDIRTGHLSAAVELINVDPTRYKRNVNAVNPLRWHGAMLTLSYTLFKRSPPPEQLQTILEALLTGLTFEQRSSVGTSLGVSVRDAACFGIWSLARKYTTQEVNAAKLQITFRPAQSTSTECTLQQIATELVLASCLDPSGNLRRGASAALQELIGRHPDVVAEGIPLVQCVDYHAVARRSNAILEVARSVAELDQSYHTSLLFACLDWRSCRAVDADSRRQTASTVYVLFSQAQPPLQTDFAKELLTQIHDLKPSNAGANAAARHGLLLSLSAVLHVCSESLQTPKNSVSKNVLADISQVMLHFQDVSGTLTGRITADLVLVLEAVAKVIGNFAILARSLDTDYDWTSNGSALLQALDRCTTASDDSTLAAEIAEANFRVFRLLSLDRRLAQCGSWLPETLPGKKSIVTCKGRLASIGRIFYLLADIPETITYQPRIARLLTAVVAKEMPIEVKVNAMESIAVILGEGMVSDQKCIEHFTSAIEIGLNDYTVDQRGDVGSWLRIASINAVQACPEGTFDTKKANSVAQAITRLAAEKLVKVRYMAWKCLKGMDLVPISKSSLRYEHQADVSSFEYYRQLTELLNIPWLRDDLLRGLESAIAGGSDDISQTASEALVSFLEDAEPEKRGDQIRSLVDVLLTQLETLKKRDDREVVPVLDTICLLVEQFPLETVNHLDFGANRLSGLLDELQAAVADIPRIQSIIRLQSDLLGTDSVNTVALDKITRKLLHKWPRVRQAAADAVFSIDEEAVSMRTDWNAAPTTNKAQVIEVRRRLGVSGKGAA